MPVKTGLNGFGRIGEDEASRKNIAFSVFLEIDHPHMDPKSDS